jgi:hypothetical protein
MVAITRIQSPLNFLLIVLICYCPSQIKLNSCKYKVQNKYSNLLRNPGCLCVHALLMQGGGEQTVQFLSILFSHV